MHRYSSYTSANHMYKKRRYGTISLKWKLILIRYITRNHEEYSEHALIVTAENGAAK